MKSSKKILIIMFAAFCGAAAPSCAAVTHNSLSKVLTAPGPSTKVPSSTQAPSSTRIPSPTKVPPAAKISPAPFSPTHSFVPVTATPARNEMEEPTPAGLTRAEDGSWYYYEDGLPLKNQWKVIKGRKYYFRNNGQAATGSFRIKRKYYVFDTEGRRLSPKKNSFVRVGEDTFYVTKKGRPIPGWFNFKKKLYYVYKNGRCAAGETVDKITFTRNGYAKNDCVAQLKKKTMKLIKKIIKPGMSKQTKLKKCWYYITSLGWRTQSYPDKSKKNWQYQCALDMLNNKAGNCYGISRGFAALVKEAGYEPYVIEIPKIHCWVRIDGKYWDNMGNRMGTVKSGKKYKKSQVTKF